jgi:hypothetical protein
VLVEAVVQVKADDLTEIVDPASLMPTAQVPLAAKGSSRMV